LPFEDEAEDEDALERDSSLRSSLRMSSAISIAEKDW
jgi:hypothetical protein